jgi:hypothetical protein
MKKIELNFWTKLAALFLVVLIFAGSAFAQASQKINWERMQRDLDIMEGVLSKLLRQSSYEWGPIAGHVSGIYFENYGVVFHVEQDGLRIFTLSAEQLEHSLTRLKEITPRPPAAPDEEETVVVAPKSTAGVIVEADAGKRLEHIQSRTTEFLANYADAIGQLNVASRITVVFDFGESQFQVWPGASPRREKDKPIAVLEMSALKGDIIEHRRGKLSFDEFQKRLTINHRSDDESMNANLDIMASILETALGRRHREGYYLVGKNRGVYLKGLGALFFLSAETNLDAVFAPRVQWGEGKEVVQVRVPQAEKKSSKDSDELLKNFESSLIELIGDYGHTLRNLAPSEQVAAAVNFNSFWSLGDESVRRLILMVKKPDLDAYNRGNLKLAEFKQKVQVQRY